MTRPLYALPAPPDPADGEGRPRVRVGTDPDAIRVLGHQLDGGLIPNTYVAAGKTVVVEEVSGSPRAAAGDEDSPLPLSVVALSPPALAGLLARHAYVYRQRTQAKTGEGYEEETTRPGHVLAAVLARQTWPTLPPLLGMIGAPVLRPDGTLLQQPGYDPGTGLYLAAKVHLPPIPDRAHQRAGRPGPPVPARRVPARLPLARTRRPGQLPRPARHPDPAAVHPLPDPLRRHRRHPTRLRQNHPHRLPRHALRPTCADLARRRRRTPKDHHHRAR